ncbi:MAG: hypothetical protein ACLURP_07270 [Ruminococcus sp.]
MNRSDIMRISALFEIALGSASLIAARFWIGTTNIVGRHVSHGDTTEAFALTYAFTLLQIAIGIIGVMNAEKRKNEHRYLWNFGLYSPDCPLLSY